MKLRKQLESAVGIGWKQYVNNLNNKTVVGCRKIIRYKIM